MRAPLSSLPGRLVVSIAAWALIVAGPVASAPAARAAKAAAPRGAEVIAAAQLRDYLSFIASNELEGRDTPSRGLDTAARFLATELARFGLEPAGDEGFFQRMTMTRRRIDPAGSKVVLKDRTFAFGDEFIASVAGSATAPLVYVGHGYVVKAKGICLLYTSPSPRD